MPGIDMQGQQDTIDTRSRKGIYSSMIFCALLLSAALPGYAQSSGESCCSISAPSLNNNDGISFLEQRMASADLLIDSGVELNDRTRKLIERIAALPKRGSSPCAAEELASSLVTANVFDLYENLFKQYEEALAQYKQHRSDYFAHVQQFHNDQSQPEMISPTVDANDGNQNASFEGMQALKYKVQDRCTQLQQLEATIIANEAQLEEMVSNLVTSQSKESAAMFAASWAAANQLAVQNGTLAGQFNHLGLMKTAQFTHSVHNLIEEANRDGAYNAHMQAYRDLSNSNNMEQQINKRSKMHGQFAMETLSQLAGMRPPGQVMNAPDPNQRVYSADELQQESNALDQEYARVQDLFGKLDAVRKSMPPSLKQMKGITK